MGGGDGGNRGGESLCWLWLLGLMIDFPSADEIIPRKRKNPLIFHFFFSFPLFFPSPYLQKTLFPPSPKKPYFAHSPLPSFFFFCSFPPLFLHSARCIPSPLSLFFKTRGMGGMGTYGKRGGWVDLGDGDGI